MRHRRLSCFEVVVVVLQLAVRDDLTTGGWVEASSILPVVEATGELADPANQVVGTSVAK